MKNVIFIKDFRDGSITDSEAIEIMKLKSYRFGMDSKIEIRDFLYPSSYAYFLLLSDIIDCDGVIIYKNLKTSINVLEALKSVLSKLGKEFYIYEAL